MSGDSANLGRMMAVLGAVASMILACRIHMHYAEEANRFLKGRRKMNPRVDWGHYYWRLMPQAARTWLLGSIVAILFFMLLIPIFR